MEDLEKEALVHSLYFCYSNIRKFWLDTSTLEKMDEAFVFLNVGEPNGCIGVKGTYHGFEMKSD